MCLTLPWKVTACDGDTAEVESAGVRRQVLCLATPDVKVGDFVVVNGSMVVRRLSTEAAAGITHALTSAMQQTNPTDARSS